MKLNDIVGTWWMTFILASSQYDILLFWLFYTSAIITCSWILNYKLNKTFVHSSTPTQHNQPKKSIHSTMFFHTKTLLFECMFCQYVSKDYSKIGFIIIVCLQYFYSSLLLKPNPAFHDPHLLSFSVANFSLCNIQFVCGIFI